MFRTLLVLAICAVAGHSQWIKQTVNTTASFRGLSVVNEKVVWASGTGGSVIRTVDGGKAWDVIVVPGAEKLDFRDIEAFDANTAYILSIGNGADSRIYKTVDGGKTWKEQFRNANEKAFFDAVACWDKKNCVAMSDPVDGHYVLINTTDGETWKPIVSNQLPAAKDGEAAFAASGTCLYINPANGDLFLVSGGTDARVFKSTDRGKSWTVATTPIVKGTAGSGIFSIAMADKKNGVIVGGNYEKPDERNKTFAMTHDGGTTWHLGSRPTGYRSGVTSVDKNTVIAVGTNGGDVSFDRRLRWQRLGNENLNAVDAKGRRAVWAVGPRGSIFQLDSTSLVNTYRGPNPSSDYHRAPDVVALTLGHSTISEKCSSSDSACSVGRKVKIAVTTIEWDLPHEFVYEVTAGKIVGDGAIVEWDLTGVPAGEYTVTAAISVYSLMRWEPLGLAKTKTIAIR